MSTEARPVTVTAETDVKAAVVKGADAGAAAVAGPRLRRAVPDDDRRREAGDDDLRGPEGERPRGPPADPARQRAQTLSSPTVLPPEEPVLAVAGFSAAFPSPPEDPLLDPPSPEPEPPDSSPAPRRLLP